MTGPAPLPDGFDRRLTAARGDIAAAHLKDKVEAERYVTGAPAQVRVPTSPLLRRPDRAAHLDTQILFGETVQVYERAGEWAWVQADLDGYVGYTPVDALSDAVVAPGAVVRALRTFVYRADDLKSEPLALLSMNAKVRVLSASGAFSLIARNGDRPWGHVFTDHLSAPEDAQTDPVAVAERFLGTPYLWGGKDSLGLDCSGLVQTAYEACGKTAPRDSDQQMALGTPLPLKEDLSGLQRGDLVFWKGHVGLMADGARMLHANATHMAVTLNDLSAFAARVEAEVGPITAVHRQGAEG